MATITSLANDLCETERPIGVILPNETIIGLLVSATRFYAGYSPLAANKWEKTTSEDITADTDLTLSEWSLIRPLFLLYVERETALQLEASRVMGADPWGRSSSEISAEIQQAESEMSHKAFCQPFFTV